MNPSFSCHEEKPPFPIARGAKEEEDPQDGSLSLPEPWFVADVRVSDRILGRGTYGTVYAGTWLGTRVAVKKLHDIYFEMTASPEGRIAVLKLFARELHLFFQLRHPNLVQLFGVYKASGAGTLDVSADTYLVQELMRCSLDQRNRSPPKLTLRNVVDVSLGIASALRYLHERPEPIIHRDLASKNVLLSDSGTPKVADFGVAKMAAAAAGGSLSFTRLPGTDAYMPPETRLEGSPYTTLVDVYSFGVVLLELCIGRNPSASEAFRVVADAGGVAIVPEGERRRKDLEDLGGEHVLRALVLFCLSEQRSRPSSKDVFDELARVRSSTAYAGEPDVPVFPHSSSSSELHHPPASPTRERENPSSSREARELRAMLEEVTRENALLQASASLQQQQQQSAGVVEGRGNTSPRSHHPRERLERKEGQQQAEVEQLRAMLDKLQAQKALVGELAALRNEPAAPVPPSARTGAPLILQERHHLQRQQQGTKPAEDELKKLRKLVEKYKNANIDLDLKLKDAQGELQKYAMGHTSVDLSYQHDLERLRQENAQVKLQLDSALRDNARLQTEITLGRRY